MPKVHGPCFSISASGSLGKAITYQRSNANNNVKSSKYRKKLETAKLLLTRKWFKKAYYVWRNNVTGYGYYISAYCTGLTEVNKNKWIRSAVIKRMTGINYFMQGWVSRSSAGLAQYQIPPDIGFCLADEWLSDNLTCSGKLIMEG